MTLTRMAFERADGSTDAVTLLCKGGFEGERIDGTGPPAGMQAVA